MEAKVGHEFTRRLLIGTVQAPHWPWSHPFLFLSLYRRLSIPHFWARTMPDIRSSAGTRQTVNFWSIARVNKCAVALMKCSFILYCQ